jgi:2-phosphosulfolactate phosphatase
VYFDQAEFDVRCEWGERGIEALRDTTDVFVIVDVLSFSTCVDVAVGRGATVYPYRWQDESAAGFASSVSALLASPMREYREGVYTLAPSSLVNIPEGTRLVLPSPNGSTLTLAAGGVPTFVGCLRNAKAVADAASKAGRRVSVIAAGERWQDGSLRFAVEDLIGAGAIIHHMQGNRSPEADVAEAAFLRSRDDLLATLQACSSGKELIERGHGSDVELAAALNASDRAPMLDGQSIRSS